MKIMRLSERIGYIGKSKREKQQMISIAEAYSLWKGLVFRYDSVGITRINYEFVKDADLKLIVKDGIQVLEEQIVFLENMMREFLVPMPSKPPAYANICADINALTDRVIFRDIFNGMQNAMFEHISSFQRSRSSIFREVFRKFLIQEMELYDRYYEYGKLKAYLNETPSFRI